MRELHVYVIYLIIMMFPVNPTQKTVGNYRVIVFYGLCDNYEQLFSIFNSFIISLILDFCPFLVSERFLVFASYFVSHISDIVYGLFSVHIAT